MTCQERIHRKDRVSEYICGASERSERAIFGVFNSFTVKKVNFFTINVNFKVILSSKSGGGGVYLYRPSPHPKKWGIHPPLPPPPPPRDLRQCVGSRRKGVGLLFFLEIKVFVLSYNDF